MDLPWVSLAGSDFNRDFGAFTEAERQAGTGFNFATAKHAGEIDLRRTELMALSCFALQDGVVYHTYSAYDRGRTRSTRPGSCSIARRPAASCPTAGRRAGCRSSRSSG